MLIRFEVSNFRSILDTAELSMVAVDSEREETRPVPLIGESLVPVAAIFGPNASGKSNVIQSMAWLCDAIVNSIRFWEDGIPVEPFAFSEGTGKPTEFTVEMAVAGVRYTYELTLDANEIHHEALYHYPEKRPRRIFERTNDGIEFNRGLGKLSGTRPLLTPRTLALSAARRFNEPTLTSFANSLVTTQSLGGRAFRTARYYGRRRLNWSTRRLFEREDQETLFEVEGYPRYSSRKEALELLRLADLGIDDVIFDHGTPEPGDRAPKIRLIHRTDKESRSFDLELESDGTRTWFDLIGPVLFALRNGSIVLFDELDASLHPTLTAELLRLFHDKTSNPLNAQLVFAAHNTSLLNHLNRDEVWLTEKNANGSTRLGALAEFAGERVRKSQNLEAGYLHGRFGALPDVDRSNLLRVLGLDIEQK